MLASPRVAVKRAVKGRLGVMAAVCSADRALMATRQIDSGGREPRCDA